MGSPMPAGPRPMPAIPPRRTGRPCGHHQGGHRIPRPAAARPGGPVLPAGRRLRRGGPVDLAVALVGGFAGQQACGQRDHLPDVGVCPGLQGRRPYPESGHVLVEVELLDDGEPAVGGAVPVRGGQQDIVDVGHVAAHDHLGAVRVQHPGQRVDPHEGRGVSQVGDVVGGDTAGVHPGPALQRQRRPAYRRHLRQASSQHLVHRQPPGCHPGKRHPLPEAIRAEPGPRGRRWSPERRTNGPAASQHPSRRMIM